MAGRAILDQNLQANVTFGVVAFTVCTGVIDLGAVTPFPVTEQLTVQIVTTAGTNAANNKNVNITIQHANANANANFINIAELAPVTILEVAAGYAATTANFTLPPATRQYLRALVKGEANGGNANDGTCTLRLAF